MASVRPARIRPQAALRSGRGADPRGALRCLRADARLLRRELEPRAAARPRDRAVRARPRDVLGVGRPALGAEPARAPGGAGRHVHRAPRRGDDRRARLGLSPPPRAVRAPPHGARGVGAFALVLSPSIRRAAAARGAGDRGHRHRPRRHQPQLAAARGALQPDRGGAEPPLRLRADRGRDGRSALTPPIGARARRALPVRDALRDRRDREPLLGRRGRRRARRRGRVARCAADGPAEEPLTRSPAAAGC